MAEMAGTQTQANNVAVRFRGEGAHEMPMKSKAQSAAMHSAAEGKSTLGIPKSVGKKFVSESHGQKVKRLPAHAKSAAKRGLISEKQMKRLKDEA
jgi:hypothetical protein